MRARIVVVVVFVGAVLVGGAGPTDAMPGHTSRTDWMTVDVGHHSSCGIKTNGRLYCWGGDQHGLLGNGGAEQHRDVPTAVGTATWRSVTVGRVHACGIKTTGRLLCWGADGVGQLGNGDLPGEPASRSTPWPVAGGATDWARVSTRNDHTCAIKTSGALYCWGSDAFDILGDGPGAVDQHAPVAVGADHEWGWVDVGKFHACAITTDGDLYCWGNEGGSGALGDGGAAADASELDVPTRIGQDFLWSRVSAAARHTCAITDDGILHCWGDGPGGPVGAGLVPTGSDAYTAPVQISASSSWRTVGTGTAQTCARKSGGRLYCWGFNGVEYPDDGHGPVRFAPTPNWSGFAVGASAACARSGSGRLYCWGYSQNGPGELGVGDHRSRAQPTEVVG